ncbi:MAG: sugar transferase [Deltaproteobacteria bacterium]|nr:sugar transferase [Deltaproteobacteria bacterium]
MGRPSRVDKKVEIVKRAMDVVGAALGLAVTAPFFAVAAAFIKLNDRGPIFYRQKRAGAHMDADGVATEVYTYEMIKFRTMRTDAEKGSARPIRATEGDPRVTRIGRLLRKTRLDELPNLINVLKGEMSIVGPRPERPETIHDLAAAIPFFEERMRNVRPGITGLAQINLDYLGHMDDRHEMAYLRQSLVNPFGLDYQEPTEADDMRTKILFDFAYAAALEKFSTFLLTDLEIILRTPLVMFLGKGR